MQDEEKKKEYQAIEEIKKDYVDKFSVEVSHLYHTPSLV